MAMQGNGACRTNVLLTGADGFIGRALAMRFRHDSDLQTLVRRAQSALAS
jgi:nucleoside-diphosphate-sugar epimerase